MESGESVPESTIVFAPGVGSSYGNGWKQLWKYFLELFLIGIIVVVISIPSSIFSYTTSANEWMDPSTFMFLAFFGSVMGIFSLIYNLLVVGPVNYGVAYAYLRAARGDKLEIKDMFESFKNYLNVVLANLVVGIIVFIGFILLIIPGIIFACKLAFTPYLVVEWKMDVITAIKESWRMTDGYALDVFLIGLLGIPIVIAGLICFGVGVIVSFMWITLALASLYHAVSLQDRASLQKPV